MCRSARALLLWAIVLSAVSNAGCYAPHPAVRQSQLVARQLHEQNRALMAQREQAAQSAAALAAERQRLEQELDVAQRRFQNLQAESSELRNRMVGLINRDQKNPLSADTTERFRRLAEQFPEFEFDPQTGVSKFSTDILFASGSADLRSGATPALDAFARILNEGDAQRLNVLVVGHTDDQRIARQATAQKHPTNWHLSTNRANSVVVALAKLGIKESRMGVAGYSMHQPLVPNKDDQSRQQNRRVEIYVLAPDAVVAGWDPGARN